MESLKERERSREPDFVPDERRRLEDSREYLDREEAPKNRHNRAQPALRRLSISKVKREPDTHSNRGKTTKKKNKQRH
jgi:hypothetical protein